MNFLPTIVDWVGAHQSLAFAAAFLLALLEAIPLAGGFIPGSTAIIAIAALVSPAFQSLGALIAAAAAGAFAGDGFCYWVGHRYQRQILTHRPLCNYPHAIEHGEAFIHRHGSASIVFGRFVPPVRALVPLLAGILRMPVRQFVIADLAADVLWASAHVLSGALIGRSMGWIESPVTRYVVFAGAIAAGTAFLLWHYRRHIRPKPE